MLDYTVTISEAAEYSGIPIRKWFDWMEQGLVPASPGPPGTPQRSDYPALAAVCRIPVSFLPRHAALRFCQERILRESFFSIDFIGFLNRYGEAAFLCLLRTIQLLKRAAALPRANTLTPDWNSLAVFKAVRNRKYKVHPNGIHYRGDFYWHPALQEYISRRGQEDRYVQIYDFDQSFCHSISVLYNGRFICEAEPLVRMRLMETDRLRLAQHLEEQKAARRAVSRRVTRVQQVLRASGVSSSRYAECVPDSNDMTLPLYAEEIDSQRDRQEAVILSETAHTLGRIALQQQKAVEQMLHGPEDDPLTDYLLKIGAGKHN